MQNPSFSLPLPLPLPEELIEEILLRLPVRSLLRLKLVCKSWLSLISDPNFAKSHHDLAAEPTHRFLYTSKSVSEVHSIDIEASLDDHSSLSNHVLPHPISAKQFDGRFYNRILIYGSCRGFLLLNNSWRNLLVWNPSTGACCKPIPNPHVKFKYDSLYGFWYDASTDDYLVLHMAMPNILADSPDWVTHNEIFSMKSNSWDQIEGFKFHKFRCGIKAGLLLNGALHWLVYDADNFVIIAFDLIGRNLLEIPLPYGIPMEAVHLRVMGDCLCLCNPGRSNGAVAEIWMMKDYKVHSSWTKTFVLLTYDIPYNFFLPMCFTKSEGLFGSNCSGSLVKFNSKGVLTEHRTYRNEFETLLQSAMYRESLLSLPGTLGN